MPLETPTSFGSARISVPDCLPYSALAQQGRDTWDGVSLADSSDADPSKIVLLYSGYVIDPGARDREYADGRWTREHAWPRSRAGGGMSTDAPGIGTDLHNLFAADHSVNSARNNRHFAYLPGGHQVVDKSPMAGNDGRLDAKTSRDAWEPPDFSKGVVARAVLYMACAYPDRARLVQGFSERPGELGNLTDILDWNDRFPPGPREKRRNDVVEQLQGNRNPFIDDPTLATDVEF